MKRRRSDPQATRYRIAVAALARAEKRKAAAEKAIRELRAKVRGYERRLPPERRAEIEAGTKAAKVTAAANRARWKEAETTLRTAARMSGLSEKDAPLVYLRSHPSGRTVTAGAVSGGRLYGVAVTIGGDHHAQLRRVLVWDVRRGYLTGTWRDVQEKTLRKPAESDGMADLQEAA